MQVSRNVIDAEDWANESSLSERGRIGRRDTLKRLLKTNGKATFVELFERHSDRQDNGLFSV